MVTTDLVSKKDDEYVLLYKAHIARNLPHDICKHIDYLYAQLKNIGRKETFIKPKTAREPWINRRYDEWRPHLTISNDGHYVAHTISKNPELLHTESHNLTTQIYSGYRAPLCFSPNNKYYIVKDTHGIYLSHLPHITRYELTTQKYNTCFGITISNDSQHILFEGRDAMQQSTPSYLLWTLDADGIPQKTHLKDNLLHSWAVIFHPDNNHIIHSQWADRLRLYNIATTEDIIISPKRDENVFCIDALTITPDNKTIIAKTNLKKLDTQPGYILFNIEDINNVTAITLPQQSCHKDAELLVLSIPHKKIVTHVTNEGKTLRLLDHNAQLLASHDAKENTYITALTVDRTGSYLAAGYSDGTIMIWNLFSSNPECWDKICKRDYYPITSLTFTDNQLLFSQSRAQEPNSMIGTATLWDIYGNEIMNNLGYNIVESIISPNGKTINVVTTTLQWQPEQASICDHLFTLTTYYQKDELLAQYDYDGPNLAQLSRLINEKYKLFHDQ
jgi:WD40 repeat protein